LATLAYKHSKGDWSAVIGTTIQKEAIKTVAKAINNPVEFWIWVKDQKLTYSKNKVRIEAAKNGIKRCKFTHDKAMMFAAAYFSIKDEVPQLLTAEANNNKDFPYWIAIDKHTSVGKDVLFEADDKYSTRAGRLAFYFEGSKCNKIISSPFWELAKKWEFDNMNYTFAQAHSKWNELMPKIIELTKTEAEELKLSINSKITKDGGAQLRLL